MDRREPAFFDPLNDEGRERSRGLGVSEVETTYLPISSSVSRLFVTAGATPAQRRLPAA
jgi:hypothetical protein